MNGLSTFLWFDDCAREAAEYYVSVFPNSRILRDEAVEGAPGDSYVVSFELDGRPFSALNGGPDYSFTPAISFVVSCESQAEVDYFWDRLTDGGSGVQCGWLVDRFGVSWQVVPQRLFELIGGADAEGRTRATAAMLAMRRIDIAALEAAYAGE